MNTSIIKASDKDRQRALSYRNSLATIDPAFRGANAHVITHLDYAVANLIAELEVQAQLDLIDTQIAYFGETPAKIFTALEKVGDIPIGDGWFNLTALKTGLTPGIKFTDTQRGVLQKYKELRDRRDLTEDYVAKFRQCKASHIREATTKASFDGSVINVSLYDKICMLLDQKSESVTHGQIKVLLDERRELSKLALLPDHGVPKMLDDFYHEFALQNNSPAAFEDAIQKMAKIMLKSEISRDYL